MNSLLSGSAAAFCTFVLAACAAHSARLYKLQARFLRPLPLAALGAAIALGTLMGSHDPASAGAEYIALICCAVAAITDAQTGYVFDSVTLPSLAAVLAIAAFTGSLELALGGALCAGGCLGFLWIVTRGRGLGGGDVKLACCIGAASGITGGLTVLAIAFVAGGAYAAYLLATGRAKRGTEMRFAPYLAASLAALFLMRTLP